MPPDKETQPLPENEHRPGAVPGPPAQPRLTRPGALATPAQAGTAPTLPGAAYARPAPAAGPEIVSTAVNPPSVSAPERRRPPLEARPEIRPAGAQMIAAPWRERTENFASLSEAQTPAEVESPAPKRETTPGMERAAPRAAGVRVQQLSPAAWPWAGGAADSASAHIPAAKAATATETGDEVGSAWKGHDAVQGRQRRISWKGWCLFALVWGGLLWLTLEREEALDRAALEGARNTHAMDHAGSEVLPSHIGVENPREIRLLKEPEKAP